MVLRSLQGLSLGMWVRRAFGQGFVVQRFWAWG